MKNFFKEFGDFIKRGNVLDLAVGIIIGGAFNKIVSSLVNDVLMPIISIPFSGDLTAKFSVLRGTAFYDTNAAGELVLVKSADSVLLYYGRFIQSIIDFLIIGFTLFVIIKVVVSLGNKRKQKNVENDTPEEEPAEEVAEELVISEEVLLLREIRDSLKK